MELNWSPRQLEGAFGGAYRRYRIDGIKGMDVDTFFEKTRKFIIDLLRKETSVSAAKAQTTTWIRFVKDEIEYANLVFNSRMLSVYQLSDIHEIVSKMITHMCQQIENPSLKDSRFEFDSIIRMDIDFHRLNLTRGSSYLPLKEWLSRKGAVINPKNNDMECFKWSIIAATKWEEIGDHPERISKLKRYEDDFDWDNVKFPVSFRDINRFESRNEITINILSYEDKEIYICRKGKEYIPRRTGEKPQIANLMIIRDHNKRH